MPRTLFEYRLRESPRARNVSLRVTVEKGLEVVVPKGYDPRRVPRILESMKDWIRRALERAAANRALLEPEPPWHAPCAISLSAVERQWQVAAVERDGVSVTVRETQSGRLSLRGRLNDEQACRAALTRWLTRQAYAHLVPELEVLSRRLGLRYRDVRVRRQRTRWGSCSSRKTITLNAKLLFLPPALMRSVLIHELCHLVEMNHSQRFWRLVAQYDPDFRTHRKQLHEGWKLVPRWAR